MIGDRLRGPRLVGLDVVRSIAILFVLASHCGSVFAAWYGVSIPWQIAVAGFYGVELFFVLSGFLIGRLLIDILDRGATPRAWLVFMIRRWMRTLPVYFAWVLVLALVWPPPPRAAGYAMLWPALSWYLSLTQNLGWGMVADWFNVSWSLTVEEWFYLGFSGLLFATAALAGRRVALWATLAVFLAVPAVLRWHLPESVDWDRVTSMAVIYRLDAIAFGVVAAWIGIRRPGWFRHHRILLALGALIIACVWTGQTDVFPAHIRHTFIFDATSLGFALCLPASVAMRQAGRGWLAPVARALSAQSYAIYITHLSLIEFMGFFRVRLHIPPGIAVTGTVLAIYGLSYLSWRFFEAPILARRPPQYPATAPWRRAEALTAVPAQPAASGVAGQVSDRR